MRNALSTIDNNEKRLNLIESGGYRAISPGSSLSPFPLPFLPSSLLSFSITNRINRAT